MKMRTKLAVYLSSIPAPTKACRDNILVEMTKQMTTGYIHAAAVYVNGQCVQMLTVIYWPW